MAQNTSTKCRLARLVGELKKTKRKEGRHPKQWQTGYLPRRPTSSDQNQLCMVGGLRCVVIHVKCDPNRSRGYGAVGVEYGSSPLLWPVAYTTACTTVQAVISVLAYWYSHQHICVWWFNFLSNGFHIGSGTHQGGMLSTTSVVISGIS